MKNLKAVTEGKSEVVAMTHRDMRAKTNWKRRRKSPHGVPSAPRQSFILVAAGASMVIEEESTGCTAGLLIMVLFFYTPPNPSYKLAIFTAHRQMHSSIA
ncbi:OLC1v1034569C1 [Oldenlandia corymbosa var. corymbosa]|uniref:OLC1v1034569C1 n=1 Tax=Oldenlandia corymbosa var. corymbosa TaxID=529605 RepID=A0AAV1CQZ9_OLDCO|nr:OLC1v1034569C1 [Oldenlandia corymbosa var. corymbosa]